jgi:hypothetical protein
VKIKTLSWMLTGGLLWAGAAAAEPLDDVRTRLAALRTDQPVHLTVEVELKHRGSAPLHLNRKKERGKVRVEVDPDSVRLRNQGSVSGFTHLSLWRDADTGSEGSMPLLDEEEARGLADPAGTLELALRDATLLEDKAVTWRDQPARLVVIRPAAITEAMKQAGEPPAEGMVPPFGGEVRLWLDESGVPLALEQWTELRLGPALMVSQHQTLNFRQVGGRLMVADVEEVFESTALKVLRGRDTRKMKVKVEPSV